MTAVQVLTGHDQAAAGQVALKQKFYAATSAAGAAARAGALRRANAEAVIAAGDAVDAGGAVFHREFYPRAGRVICALGCVIVLSAAGRWVRIVFDADEHSAPGAER